ncbi:hypothetical protein HYT23_00560 [Candidatus Pacearchaeota archaeon]|nr:hypothetical protein [Candidatus Pacearchaeota archaeon]
MTKSTLVSSLYFAGAIIFGAGAIHDLGNYKAYSTTHDNGIYEIERVKTRSSKWFEISLETIAAGFLLTKGLQKAREQ